MTQLGDFLTADNANWTFGSGTASYFPEHIRRSVPFYEEGHALICQLSEFFVKENSRCYELGTSCGELIKKCASHHKSKPDACWIGIDKEPEMIEKAKANCKEYTNIELFAEDINLMVFQETDLIICYYTLQFIHPKHRQNVISQLYNALNWGGALLMFEKVRGADARFQDILTTSYTDFKLNNGYSPEEIIAKSRSLKGILEPFSTQGNLDLLKRAGFTDIMTVFKYLCFEGFLAIK